ncbi:MAG: hypothetical protein R2800_02565 [Flavipsychrobacter sp.]
MKIVTKLSAIVIACLLTMQAQAQTGAIGVRATLDGAGFTGKVFVTPNIALEGQLNAGGINGLEGKSLNAVGLIEAHIPLPNPQWRLIFGGGMHAGTWDRGRWFRESDGVYITDRPEPIFGFDAIGGVEYVFKKIPLGLSADVKPAVNVNNGVSFFQHNFTGVSARYYFR